MSLRDDVGGNTAFRRFRPLRNDQETRDAHAEVALQPGDFIQPYFVVRGEGIRQEIPSLKNVYHLSIDCLIEDMLEKLASGIDKILLFGVVPREDRDESGFAAYADGNLISNAVESIKDKYPDTTVITDVCLCGYTSHGHCGLVGNGDILNDDTIPLLAQTALSHARAGADMVAPSAMMDGQVHAIRQLLDESGCSDTRILSYSAKYASGFYGPFRGAVDSAPSFGDRRSYQMDFRVKTQALEEIRADLDEGADAVMIKPAHAYLDVINTCRAEFPGVTLAAYHVSGEYMLIMNAAEHGLIDAKAALLEVTTAIKRAGADWIISYGAGDIVKWI